MDRPTYEEWVRQENRRHKIKQRVKWTLGTLLLLLGVGSCRHCRAVDRAEYAAWEKTVTPEESARIDGLMSQVAEGSYGDLLLMRDGSVLVLWNPQKLSQQGRYNGGQLINVCKGPDYECSKSSGYHGEWRRRDFALIDRFVRKNPDDPEWNRLAGKFLLQ